MKRTVRLCLAIFFVLTLWILRTPLQHRCRRLENIFYDHLAQGLFGTRFEDSPSAHSLLASYANLQRYHAANRALAPLDPGRVVFYGDSITDFWATKYPDQFFLGAGYLGRGIAGQATREMVWRFQQDVIDLHPATVVILAGSNDVILPERHITYTETTANLQAMAQAARRHGIRVILCSLLPVWRAQKTEEDTDTQQIRAINSWLRRYADQQHLTYLDYFTAMSTASGTLNIALSNDGVHPNAAGYARMQSLASQALQSP